MLKRKINQILSKLTGYKLQDAKVWDKPYPISVFTAQRIIYFHDMLKRIASIEGDIVECGVGGGRSLFLFYALSQLFNMQRDMYGYDSFEGIPELAPEDEPEINRGQKGRYSTNKDTVIYFLEKSGVPRDFVNYNMTLHKGFFSDGLSYKGGGIALLHLDVDLYQSYKDTLEFFYPKVKKGGVIMFDEYQATIQFPGARKAIDEYFAGKEKIQKSNIIQRHYIVKE